MHWAQGTAQLGLSGTCLGGQFSEQDKRSGFRTCAVLLKASSGGSTPVVVEVPRSHSVEEVKASVPPSLSAMASGASQRVLAPIRGERRLEPCLLMGSRPRELAAGPFPCFDSAVAALLSPGGGFTPTQMHLICWANEQKLHQNPRTGPSHPKQYHTEPQGGSNQFNCPHPKKNKKYNHQLFQSHYSIIKKNKQRYITK